MLVDAKIVKMENELVADFAGSSTENNGFKTPIRATHSMVHKRHLETPTSILEDSCFEENNEGISVHNPKVEGLGGYYHWLVSSVCQTIDTSLA